MAILLSFTILKLIKADEATTPTAIGSPAAEAEDITGLTQAGQAWTELVMPLSNIAINDIL
jgi:hypothetical protein